MIMGELFLLDTKRLGKGKFRYYLFHCDLSFLVLKKSLTNLIRENHQYISFKF